MKSRKNFFTSGSYKHVFFYLERGCDMDHTKAVDHFNRIGRVSGGLGVFGEHVGAPESVDGHSGSTKHPIFVPKP